MPESTTTTFHIGQGATKISNGSAIGSGVSVGKVNGGVGITTPMGSASVIRSSHHHSSSGIGSGASITSTHSRSSHDTSSVVSTPTLINGGSHSLRTTHIESGVSNISAGAVTDAAKVAVTGAQMFAEATLKEKEEMQRLNDRLSNYIARVKQLEEQNKQLVISLTELRSKWGTKNDSFKSSYSVNSSAFRSDKDTANRARIAQDVTLARITADIVDYRARIEEINRVTEAERKRVPQWIAAISEADSELGKLHKRYEAVAIDEKMALNEQDRLRKDLHALYEQLDGIMIDKVAYQNQLQSIRDELKFLRSVHEEEVRELQGLLVLAPADTKEFFRNEIALAVRDIRKEYQLLASAGKTKLETWYKSKVHGIQELASRRGDDSVIYLEQVKKMSGNMTELSTRYSQMEGRNRSLELEVQKLQKQVDEDHLSYEQAMAEYDKMLIRMREECATLVAELQSLLDSKALLDGEIAIYRAMIDGEERRVGVTVVQHVQHVQHVEEEHADQWEVATKTKFNTLAHGNVAIIQSEPTGRFIVITNNSDHVEERIGGWHLKRVIDNSRVLNFYFPAGYVLRPRQKIRIFANGQGSAGPDSLVFEGENSWGIGANIMTALYSATGEEKAVYTQRVVISNA